MGKGLNDFLIETELGIFTPDLDRLSKLPIEEFRRRYIEDMQIYLDSHPVPIVKCEGCFKNIDSADNLVRRYGSNLHRECFKEVHDRKRKKYNEYDKGCFDLILASLNVDDAGAQLNLNINFS